MLSQVSSKSEVVYVDTVLNTMKNLKFIVIIQLFESPITEHVFGDCFM